MRLQGAEIEAPLQGVIVERHNLLLEKRSHKGTQEQGAALGLAVQKACNGLARARNPTVEACVDVLDNTVLSELVDGNTH